jgi:predicted Zn-dependent protease
MSLSLRGKSTPQPLLFSFSMLLYLAFFAATVGAQNLERELAMGQEAKEQLEQQIGFYQHPANEYLTSIGDRLVSNLEDRVFDYHFGILDMKEPNALAVPGGDIYFSRGILLLANSEEELGGVMGHEIIHVYKSHSRKASNRSILTGIFKVPGAIVGVFAPTAGGILMAPFAMFDAGYSRKNEKQADELGAQLAAKSGYNPEGLATILGKISSESAMETGAEEQRSFFSTHPYTPKRLDDLDKTIKKINYDDSNTKTASRAAFLKSLEGIVIGDNPAHGVFHESQFLHPELNIAFSYPEGWDGVNTPMFVGVVSPDRNAQLVLSLGDTIKSPSKTAGDFAREYYRYYGYEPKRDEALEVNGYPAHILSYEGQSEEGLIVLSFLWLRRDEHMYRFAALGTAQYKNVIMETVESFHMLKNAERELITQTVLKVVESQQGETLKELTERTGNTLTPAFTALINDLDEETVLPGGSLVKIGSVEAY